MGNDDMTDEVHRYLETKFSALEAAIKNVIDKVADVTEPIKKDVDRLRGDIDQLFTLSRGNESRVLVLEDNKDTHKANVPLIASIVFGLAGVTTAIVALM